jgi:hypothetical protein
LEIGTGNSRASGRYHHKLRTLNSEFRKVKGHNGDQWNDRADALANTGRDGALAWPKCSFEVVMPTGTVPFRKRAMRSDWTLAEVRAQLATGTNIVLRDGEI